MIFMSELQKQALEIIGELSEENLKAVVKFMQIFIQQHSQPFEETGPYPAQEASKRIGIAEGEELYVADYDIDEYNGEITKLFGVV